MKKRMLNLVLAMLLIVCMIPFAASAAGTEYAAEKCTYRTGNHNWDEGMCTRCNLPCAHAKFEDGVCATCGLVCKHTSVATIPAEAATCETPAMSKGKQCKTCGVVTEKPVQTAPKLGHDYSVLKSFYAGEEPTCQAPGKAKMGCSRCTKWSKQTYPALSCNIVTTKAVAATCNNDGATAGHTCTTCEGRSEAFKCVYCEANKQEVKTVTKLGHNINLQESKQVELIKAPTCKETGTGKYKCTRCEYKENLTIPKVECEPVDLPVWPATCTEPGKAVGTKCKYCEKIMSGREATPALGHDFSIEHYVVEEATCMKEGSTVFKCSRCDTYTAPTAVAKKPHVDRIIPAEPATCKTSGKTEGLGCKNCATIIVARETVPATGHDFSITHSVITPSTCKEEGVVKTKCANCGTYRNEPLAKVPCEAEPLVERPATCTASGKAAGTKCKYCDKIMSGRETIEALGHDYEVEFTSTELTCTEKAWGKYVCTREGCTDSYTGWVPALGHSEKVVQEWNVTCTANGCTKYQCERCEYTRYDETEATGHVEEILPAVEATCSRTGLTAGKQCATCQGILEAQTVIEKKAHTWTDVEGKPASCTEDGFTSHKLCSVCGATEGKSVMEASHYFNEVKCTLCGEANPEYVPATRPGASVRPGTSGRPGTTTPDDSENDGSMSGTTTPDTDTDSETDGSMSGTTTPGDSETDGRPEGVVPACGHSHTNTVTQDKTCTSNGSEITYCTDCNTVVGNKIDYATGHKYVMGICSVCNAQDPAVYTYDYNNYYIVGNSGK